MENLNPEIINEIKKIKELIKLRILEILKQYILLVMKLEIMLLVWIQQIWNKRIY